MGKPSQEVVAARKTPHANYNRSGLTVDKYCAKFRVSKTDVAASPDSDVALLAYLN